MSGVTLHPFNSALECVNNYHISAVYNDKKLLLMGWVATLMAPFTYSGPAAAGIYVGLNTREYMNVRKPLDEIRQEIKAAKNQWANAVRFSELSMLLEGIVATAFLSLGLSLQEGGERWLRWGGSSLILCGAHMATHLIGASYYADSVEDRCQEIIDDYNSNWFTKITLSGILV